MSLSSSKIVLCTGANQGLGYGILEVAGLREPSSFYILACRTIISGDEAVKKLRDTGIKAAIDVIQLDVTNDDQIEAAVSFVEKKYGKLDVLINNAGILIFKPSDDSLTALRQAYTKQLDTNLTSVAIIMTAFMPLLHEAVNPKVINVTSGLGSISNTLTKKMGRSPPYGSSKIGMNGATIHMQTAENDRIAAEDENGQAKKEGRVRFYVVQPGVLKTAFSNYVSWGKEAKEGAEVIVRLVMDDKGTYPGGTYWEFEDRVMKQVPW